MNYNRPRSIHRSSIRYCVLPLFLVVCGLPMSIHARDNPFAAPMAAADVQRNVFEWMATRNLKDDAPQQRLADIWIDDAATFTAEQLFERTITSFRVIDAETDRFVKECRLLNPPLLPPSCGLTERESETEFYRSNIRLHYGRYLVRRRMYDEALPILRQIDLSQIVDPATALFLRAVCEHQLLLKTDGLATVDQLLRDTESVPLRYSATARLMQDELESLEDKSLDEIARRMADVERRLDLGRAGQDVQKHESNIIAMLDDLIERMEQQNGGGGGAGGTGGGDQNQPGGGADDSSVKGTAGPGEVDQRKLDGEGAWGMLDPKDEARAKQLIGRNFPPHYQQAIEQYFRRLARRKAGGGLKP